MVTKGEGLSLTVNARFVGKTARNKKKTQDQD